MSRTVSAWLDGMFIFLHLSVLFFCFFYSISYFLPLTTPSSPPHSSPLSSFFYFLLDPKQSPPQNLHLPEIVTVLTNDGRQFVGVLVSHDLSTNVVLQHCHERVYSLTEGVKQIPRATLVIRGDTVMCVGKIDEDKDLELDFNEIRGEQLNAFKY
jgi:U6 snRNA-associated Sm-like protein LSm8